MDKTGCRRIKIPLVCEVDFLGTCDNEIYILLLPSSMNTIPRFPFRRLLSSVILLTAFLFSGCDFYYDSDGGGFPGSGDTPFLGTWALYNGRTLSGPVVSYVHFNSDETFFISNNANGSEVRVRGTYMVSDGNLLGPFSNPPTGNGRVEARIENGILIMDFIEYWHTPEKTLPLSGQRP